MLIENKFNIVHKIVHVGRVIDTFCSWTRQFNEINIYYANLSLTRSSKVFVRRNQWPNFNWKTILWNKSMNQRNKSVHLPAPFLSLSSSAIKRGSAKRRRWFGMASTVDWLAKNPTKITSDAAAQSRHIIDVMWLILWLIYDLSLARRKEKTLFFRRILSLHSRFLKKHNYSVNFK